MGMVQRRETLFRLYGIQIPSVLMAPAAAATLTPVVTVPPPTAGRKERDRGTRGQSSPQEPILSVDNAKTSDSEEAASHLRIETTILAQVPRVEVTMPRWVLEQRAVTIPALIQGLIPTTALMEIVPLSPLLRGR
ncbi:uncharacterized protein LOC114255932 [Camellia sinensis]|uniref:uncharacterized protein LOC114255932 n=1 Tax=Camellia sinensis TaxID=4442 RepID=UPI0010356CEA|nr:uncharacterized protein LOC114255932 [Camellia sinensis]